VLLLLLLLLCWQMSTPMVSPVSKQAHHCLVQYVDKPLARRKWEMLEYTGM
jgi:hypothetical protein